MEIAFKAKGLYQNRERLIISTREPIIRRESLTSEEIVTDTTSRQTDKTNWINPMAQSFHVDPNNFPMGIDGCSAPTPFLSLQSIARLFQALGSGKYPELEKAYRSMIKHPYLIGGKNRFDTEFNSVLNGRGICKAGGEAIRGIVIKTEKYGLVGLAIKVLDGNQR